MKTDKKLWLAVVLLIILVCISIVLTLVKNDRIDQLQHDVHTLKSLKVSVPKPADGHTPILGIDYQLPTAIKGDKGDGAYQVALLNGFVGTEKQWLESLKGKDAPKSTTKQPKDGKSAYELAVDSGFKGSLKDWLESLKANPAPELHLECIDGHWGKKYEGDSFWQMTNIKCEVDNE